MPGASAGINIAQQLGLNSEIVAEARQRLTSQAQDVGRFLDRLHSDLREMDNERTEIGDARARVARRSAITLRRKARKSSAGRFASWKRSWKAFYAISSIAHVRPSTPFRTGHRR